MDKVNIVVIDDQPLFLMGMNQLLESSGFYVTSYNSGESALDYLINHPASIVITELNMPGMDAASLYLAMTARDINIPIIAISGEINCTQIKNTIDIGVKGFMPRRYQPDEILNVIKCILHSGNYIPRGICKTLKQRHINTDEHLDDYSLSKKQKKVLSLLAKGYSNKRIALLLNISRDTVKFHLGGIYRALNVTNRTAAVARAKGEEILEKQVA